MLDVAGWTALAVMAALVASQIVGWSGSRIVVVLQALTPYVLGSALAIAIAALVFQRWALGVLAVGAFAALGVLSRPLLRPAAQPAAVGGAPPVTIFHGNLLYTNGGRGAELPTMLGALRADVLAFTEYTPRHAALLAASPIAPTYPHRIEHPHETGGSAIWSRFPLTEIAAPECRDESSAAVVGAPQPLTLFVVHPPSPFGSLRGWKGELAALAHEPRPDRDESVIVVGDFNAAYWHPPFRRVLRTGWCDAHIATGRGFSSSWRTDWPPLPPFVRLDHALVNHRLVVDAVVDMYVPGSDHRGLVVTVRPAIVPRPISARSEA